MKLRLISFAILVGVLTTCIFAVPASEAGETYGNLRGDWAEQVQDWLTHAAMKSPKWQSQREAIERHIENIGFLLQGASLARRSGDYAVASMNMRYAIKTLELGVDRGFYRRSDVEPLKLIIAQHLPARA